MVEAAMATNMKNESLEKKTLDEEHTSTGLQNVQCGSCEARFVQARAIHWCTSCEEGLCAECSEYHTIIKATRDHSTITVQQFEALEPLLTSLKAECDDHEFPVTLYCPNHQVPCCSTCAVENHSACLGITSFQGFVSKLRKSSYLENLDATTDSFFQNIDCIVENRKANKDRLLKEADDRKSKLTKVRKEINDYLDELDNQLIHKSDEFLKEEDLRVDSILRCLEEKKKNMLQIKSNFLELRQDGTDAQVFYCGRKLVDTIKDEEESLLSLFEGPDVVETSLEFHINPKLKENILKTADVHLKKEKSSVTIHVAEKPSCQIVASDVSKVKAVLITQFDISKFRHEKGCITMMPNNEIIVCDYNGSQILVFTSDGTVNKTFEVKKKPFGLASLGKERLAVSFPEGGTIMILRTDDFSCENEIQLDGSCYMLDFAEGLLAVAFKRTDILLLDLTGNIIRTIPMTDKGLVYIHRHTQTLFRTDFEESSVYSYDQSGEKLWQFKSSEAIGPRCMCTDSHGNLFVACQNSNRVLIISKDGKNYKSLLELQKPRGLCYDAKRSIIFVCSFNGEYLSSYKLLSS